MTYAERRYNELTEIRKSRYLTEDEAEELANIKADMASIEAERCYLNGEEFCNQWYY